MTNHHFFIDDVGQRQGAEQLRESFIHSLIFKFCLNLTFEPVDVVDLFGFVVAAGHVQKIYVDAFPSYEGEDALNGERTAVDEIAVEKVFVVDGGDAV